MSRPLRSLAMRMANAVRTTAHKAECQRCTEVRVERDERVTDTHSERESRLLVASSLTQRSTPRLNRTNTHTTLSTRRSVRLGLVCCFRECVCSREPELGSCTSLPHTSPASLSLSRVPSLVPLRALSRLNREHRVRVRECGVSRCGASTASERAASLRSAAAASARRSG